jgi:hypothetical protein
MNCPSCEKEMTAGVVWLGNKTSATNVIFSPSDTVSWGRQFAAGTVFNSGLRDGEVAILQRGWAEKVGRRRSYHCSHCEIVVCDVGKNGVVK